jgi:hypothetical protein
VQVGELKSVIVKAKEHGVRIHLGQVRKGKVPETHQVIDYLQGSV